MKEKEKARMIFKQYKAQLLKKLTHDHKYLLWKYYGMQFTNDNM